MAGITTSIHLKPLPTRHTKTIPLLLSSLESKLFGIHFRSTNSFPSSSFHCSAAITARYGGDSRFSGPSRSKKNDDDDQALDISSIRSDTVRLIDEEQNMVGVVSKSQAIQMAADSELDLVILSPDADPPVVKIMDYNKYRYEQQRKKKVQQKKTVRMDLKELKMGYNIDQHDYSVRLKAARKFLNDGDKVKVIVNLKGRENEFRNMAMELIRRFQNDVGELATEESKNFRDRNIFMVLVPNKAVLQKGQDPGKKKDKPTKNEVSASV
ncbi:Translation initiation factor 3 [Corchorus olitorius]|uniref:Translation initiation factor IF-3 n=1 Tax=Corchorus olitorius TaxID=93759 RepID=A0A1R3IDS7_9ROSI|nr:Translation initiation factor 3 [Corchorus olitorius]